MEVSVRELPERPDLDKVVWDTSKLDFVPIPPQPPDLVRDAVERFPDLDASALTQAQLIALMVNALKFLVKRELNRG